MNDGSDTIDVHPCSHKNTVWLKSFEEGSPASIQLFRDLGYWELCSLQQIIFKVTLMDHLHSCQLRSEKNMDRVLCVGLHVSGLEVTVINSVHI